MHRGQNKGQASDMLTKNFSFNQGTKKWKPILQKFQPFICFYWTIASRPVDVTDFRPPQQSDKQTSWPVFFFKCLSEKWPLCPVLLFDLWQFWQKVIPGSKFEHKPDQYTVEQLKRWLKCRGLKIGEKWEKLTSCVSDCIKNGDHHILDVSIDQGKWFGTKVLKENEEISKNETIKVNISKGVMVFCSTHIRCWTDYYWAAYGDVCFHWTWCYSGMYKAF